MLLVTRATWLVHDIVAHEPTLLGGPTVVFGHAVADFDADLLTITVAGGESTTTQIGGMPVLVLAQTLLRELHRQGAAA